MITFDGVSKSYRTALGLKIILEDLDCEISTDQSVGILGRNGSGKSALMRMLAGSELPDRGRIDRDIRVSFPVGHSAGVSPLMTGRENATFLARTYGEDPARIARFVDAFAELGVYLDEPVRTYSNGMRARLAFGICIAIDFDVYLVDEVTSVGDIEFKRKSMQLFAERRRSSRIVMASSNVKMVKMYCDRGAILDRGTIRMFDDIDQAIAIYRDETYRSEIQGSEPFWEERA